ncbi:hypothetical protein [Methanobrevibacter sp.]|uniref:hypothetical protein n=1 Tax=Methanobrevibacter sp. TaxID=66852 RepID=UPI0025EB5164|nr:hypothetical protein [Methanobrevibacter sp.]MBQ6511204.1 DUF11 domain-containing protein [Methanobrevibacter sp.]
MLNKTQKIAISKNFIISMLFICLIFAAVGLNIEDSYAAELNEKGNGPIMELDIKDKLGNSQANEILEVDKSSGNILATDYSVNGRTFQDIQNVINNARAGDTIYLTGDYSANGNESTINIDKRLTITSASSATLDGEDVSSIFNITGDAHGSVISNLRFIHAEGDVGSAVYILTKNVIVDNCIFENNHANHGGVLSSLYDLYTAENLTIQNCEFRNNSGYFKSLQNFSTAGAVGVYGMNSKVINCLFDSNWVKGSGSVYGGAIQIGLDVNNYKALVYNCTFNNNYAISINRNSHGGAGCVRNGVEYVNCVFTNNHADQGGALTFHASGKLENCTFRDNYANKLYGGAVSTGYQYDIMDFEIVNCYFECNIAPKGGAIQVAGVNINIFNSTFYDNYADVYGGALNIEAQNVEIHNSNFTLNLAEVDGGAIYSKGENTLVDNSLFISNEARPDYNKLNDGLGGAIYINSTKANVCNSEFYYNTARNGSAIYYDKYGNELILNNNTLFENQAWVYLLPIYANDIFYGQTEELKSVIHGGNNIARYNNLAVSNAIYNAADYSHLSIDGESPLDGATNNGRLYQDDREYNMKILLTVEREDGLLIYNETLTSNYLGEVSDELDGLQPGKYYVTARHTEDTYYKAIINTTTFNVIPKIDSQVRKLSASESYNYDDVVVWTLNITNHGPNKATNVTVHDILPIGLVYINDDSNGSYNHQTGSLYIGDVEVNQTIIVNIYARINKTGDIVNEANVTSNEFDVNLSNNHDEASITVPKTCDLEVVKLVNNSNPSYRDYIKWTIVVRNNGPDPAHNVVMTDILPKSMIYISNSANYNKNNGKWVIGTLGVNEEVTLDIFCQVNATGTIKNDVSVKGDERDRNESNNYDSCSIKVNNSADLAIEKSINVSSANFGDEITWKIVISNNGPSNAYGVKVSDVLPDGLILVRPILPRGTYSNGVINVGSLGIGENLTYEFICKINKTGLFTNVANVSGKQYDPDKSNNRDEASITVPKTCDLEVVKSVNNSNPNYRDYIKWTIVVRNNGPDPAHNVVMTDILPKSMIYIDNSANYNKNTGKWVIGTLDVNEEVTLDIFCQVNGTGTIKNDVSVKGDERDRNESNNKDSCSIKVNNSADLVIEKSINVSSANFGDEITWKIVISNNGPSNAYGVKVSDKLPDGLILVRSILPRGSYSNGVINVGSLGIGENLTYEFICKVNKTGLFTNVANVSGKQYDPDKSNNRDEASVFINSAADLEVIKTVNVTNPNYGEEICWTITVRNNGPDEASGVVVSDLLPDSLAWVSDDGRGKYNRANGRWTIGNLIPNASVRLNIITRVVATGFTQNNVSVNGSKFDPDLSNNKDDSYINVSKTADVSVSKLVNNSKPKYGDIIKWTVIAKNNGPDKATSVFVDDVLPDGLIVMNVTLSKGLYDNGVWGLCCLENGEEQILEITCKVNKTGTITNFASISADEVDLNKSNNKDNESIKVPSTVDLEVTKQVSDKTPYFGDNITWFISIRNNGPDRATNVVVSDVLDSGLILRGYSSTVGTFKNNKWSIPRLDNGDIAYINITCSVNKLGEILNEAIARCSQVDRNESNNKASEKINVSPVTDLSVEKIVNNSNPNYGDLIKWSIIARNNGPNDATNVTVRDIMPNGVEFVSSSDNITADGTWHIGDLALNEVKQLDIICKVISTGVFENIAIISGDEHDPNPVNNRDVEEIDVPPACDLSITKTVSKYYYKVGDIVDYSIKIVNNGPDEARNVKVNEIPDKSLTFKSARASKGSYDDSNQVWNIDCLDNGEHAELYIKAMAAGADIAKNMVVAISDTFDYDSDNNQDEVLVNVSENDEIPEKHLDKANSTPNSSALDVLIDENHITANPFAVLLISIVFLMIFLGRNFSKKR